MSSPFPGMNPYLENPELWSEVHHRLITAIANAIEPQLLVVCPMKYDGFSSTPVWE